MVRNTLDIEIQRPPHDVFAYVDDDAKLRQWIGGILESSRSPGPAQPGTSFRQVVDIGGKTLELRGELIRYDADREMAVRLTSTMCDMDVTYRFEARGAATVVHYVCDSHYHRWLFRMLGPVLKRVAQKKLLTDFTKLKELLEGSNSARIPATPNQAGVLP